MNKVDGLHHIAICTANMKGQIEYFTDVLGMPAIWIPHSYASCSQHAPDEHILMPLARNAIGLMAGLYWDIGESKGLPITL